MPVGKPASAGRAGAEGCGRVTDPAGALMPVFLILFHCFLPQYYMFKFLNKFQNKLVE